MVTLIKVQSSATGKSAHNQYCNDISRLLGKHLSLADLVAARARQASIIWDSRNSGVNRKKYGKQDLNPELVHTHHKLLTTTPPLRIHMGQFSHAN